MRFTKLLKGAAVSLASWGLLLPTPSLMAAGPKSPVKTITRAQAPLVTDVMLAEGGTVTGQVVDPQGRALDGAAIVLSQSGEELARTVANDEGRFSFTNLRGGVYQITAAQGAGLYRFWTKNTAPPAAKAQALIVSGKQAVRGQSPFVPVDAITASTVILSGVAAGFSIAAYNKANDTEDAINDLEKLLSSPN